MHKRTEYYRMNKVVKVDEPAAVVCAQLSCGDPQVLMLVSYSENQKTVE